MSLGDGAALTLVTDGQRQATAARVAVIDIGSNSVRMVVYEHGGRMPIPVFNEKALCGLGAGLAETGRLTAPAIAAALRCLRRFRQLLDALAIMRVDVFATAAVRDALNGQEFVRQVHRETGFNVIVLTGGDEAKYAAYGVISGFPDADGVVGDLGGGSLEVIDVAGGALGQGTTLALGPLRLESLSDFNREDLQRHIDGILAAVPWLEQAHGRVFYAVGGAWRNLARAHMERSHYPLEILHGYELETGRLRRFLKKVSRQSADDLRRLKTISRRRQAVLPIAALVFERVLKAMRPERVAFSAFGLREGRLFSAMEEATRAVDPLLAGCGDLALRSGRGHHDPARLFAWVRPLFDPLSKADARLLRAVCVLSDVAWAGYPGHRGEQAFLRALHLPIAGLGHSERVALAMALHARYAGHLESPLVRSVSDLISCDKRVWANAVGRALRLGLTLCAGRVDVLAQTHFAMIDQEAARLMVPGDLKPMIGENIERRLMDVANILSREMTIQFEATAGR